MTVTQSTHRSLAIRRLLIPGTAGPVRRFAGPAKVMAIG
jgi:hypothetical protein